MRWARGPLPQDIIENRRDNDSHIGPCSADATTDVCFAVSVWKLRIASGLARITESARFTVSIVTEIYRVLYAFVGPAYARRTFIFS